MSCDVRISQAEVADISGIYRVTRRNWVEAIGEFLHDGAVDWDVEVPTQYREWLQTVIAHESMCQLVAETSGTIVGCAEFVWDPDETAEFVDDTEAELKAIHVSPDYWENGIGSALLSQGNDRLPEHCSGIALSVLVDNERARRFYERRGFDQDGTTDTMIAGAQYTEAVYRRSH